jgi:hypothetical protein
VRQRQAAPLGGRQPARAGERDGRREDLGLAAAHRGGPRGGAKAEGREEAQEEGLGRARHGVAMRMEQETGVGRRGWASGGI